MIIVSGKLFITPGHRDAFVNSSLESVRAARTTNGCQAFVVAPDPLDENRVNIYEEWDSQAELDAFRGNGPSDAMLQYIDRADVKERQIQDAE